MLQILKIYFLLEVKWNKKIRSTWKLIPATFWNHTDLAPEWNFAPVQEILDVFINSRWGNYVTKYIDWDVCTVPLCRHVIFRYIIESFKIITSLLVSIEWRVSILLSSVLLRPRTATPPPCLLGLSLHVAV